MAAPSRRSVSRPQPPPLAEGTPPADLRQVRVEEFLKARALAANTQKAYRRELYRFFLLFPLSLKRALGKHYRRLGNFRVK
jgi:hypothetical protein